MFIMEILKEVTHWDVDYQQPNHTYLINKKGRIVAYAKWHTNEIVISKSPDVLEKRYRKFIKDDHKGLSKLISKFASEDQVGKTPVKKMDHIRLFKVNSKNKEYLVEYNTLGNFLTCPCIGFGYRRKCKHVDAVSKKLGV
jgi:hypothetical protein